MTITPHPDDTPDHILGECPAETCQEAYASWLERYAEGAAR